MTYEEQLRFDRFVDKVTTPLGCWNWLGYKCKDGYGRFRVDGEMRLVHKIAYENQYGFVSGGVIMHNCDNASCVNPAHLKHGTQSENMLDSLARGRQNTSGRVKLTPQQVIEIRQKIKEGWLLNWIAEAHGVSRPTVSLIKANKIWSHV